MILGLGRKYYMIKTVEAPDYPLKVYADELNKGALKDVPDFRKYPEKHPRITNTIKTGWLIGSNVVGNVVK